MENLKVKVSNEAESKEVQKLFFELGLRWYSSNKKYFLHTNKPYLCTEDGKYICFGEKTSNFNDCDGEEITLQELRDMVVLKSNDSGDATHSDQDNWKWYIGEKSYCWERVGGNPMMWVEESTDHADLKPIKEEVMKEYLFKYNDKYTLVELSKKDAESNPEQYIEVPDGAEVAVYPHFSKGISFFKNNFRFAYSDSLGEWRETDYCSENLKHWKSWRVAWQRESLNDKIATAEVARQQSKNIDATLAERQSQYGSFEDVTFVTENIIATLAKVRSNGLQDLPHTHRMALYMIASKMARIVNGDFNHLDSWHDIGGYSKLIEDLINDSITVDW